MFRGFSRLCCSNPGRNVPVVSSDDVTAIPEAIRPAIARDGNDRKERFSGNPRVVNQFFENCTLPITLLH